MEKCRTGESGSIPFRTGRFFMANGQWYFACREGFDHGPYATRDDAETALGDFLQNLGALPATTAAVS